MYDFKEGRNHMDTVIVESSQFHSHYPKRIPQGTVNAEAVLIRLDSEWDNLTIRIHWLNVASNVERKPLLERDQPNTIPWEVLTDLGELRMGLVGLDGETVIKPTIWLTYGYVSDGVDPEAGEDPQPPTPSWEQQMVALAEAAANAAKAAKETADNLQAAADAGEFNGDPGPAGPPGKSPIIRNGTWWIWNNDTQDYTDTGVVASGGGGGVSSYNDLSDRPTIGGVLLEGNKTAEQLGLATPSQIPNVPSWAMQPQKPAYTAQEVGAQPTGNYALRSEIPTKLPNPYALTINGQVYDGSEAMSVEAVGGGAGGELLLAEYVHQGNKEIHFASFDWETGIGECTEPHGLSEPTQAMLVWNDWMAGNVYANATAMPIEWTSLDQYLYLVPTDDTHVMVTGNDKSTPITVDASNDFNKDINASKIHFEVPVGFRISDIPELYTKVQLTILGIVMGNKRYRYTSFICRKKDGRNTYVNTIDLLYPPYFGVATKPRHGLLTSHNITFELNNVVGGSFLYSNYFTGRRNNYVGMPGEAYTEIKRTIQPYSPTEFFGVTGIDVDPTYAVWANGTRFRLYGLCKGGEHN